MSDESTNAHLLRLAQEIKAIRQLVSKVIFYISEAESEVPEKMRRFMNYMHDLHDIKYMYEELGVEVPKHHLREMERCDDRFRQLINEQNSEDGTFSKVRREMASDPLNKWDHTRQLPKPTHEVKTDAARTSESKQDGIDEG